MFGFGVLRGMMVTLKHFVETYTEDPKRIKARALTPDAVRQTPNDSKGLFTVQYPEEKLAIPERFRFYPMLIVDADTGQDWCTSCGICAKVCPPQCIWIVRGTKPDGKPKPEPEEFYIDTTICMQCGYCAEFCPFDAIKMNHDYELSSYERHESAIYNKDILSVTTTYYARTHPRAWAEEAAARDAKESKKTGGGAAAETPRVAPAPAAASASPAPVAAPAAPGAKPKPIPARLAKQMREQAAGEAGHEASHAPEATTPTASAAPAAPAVPTTPAAPATPTTGETLPSGRPKPIPARLAKQMREQAAQQGGAPAAPTSTTSHTAAPSETPTEPGVPSTASVATTARTAPSAPTPSTAPPMTSATETTEQMREEAAQAGASGQNVGSHGAGEPTIIPNPRETAETRLAADQAALAGAVDANPAPSRSQPSEEVTVGMRGEPGLQLSQTETSASASQPASVVPQTPVLPDTPASPSAPPTSTEWQGGKPAWVGPDDLTIIEGIGPKIAELFHTAGITTFRQLAETSADRMRQILAAAGPRFRTADPTTWAEQARLAAAGEWEALKRLQDRLSGGRNRG